MHLNRQTIVQLIIFGIVSAVAIAVMVFGYVKAPANFLGVGRYEVTVELAESGNLYSKANVTYHGTEVGTVTDVLLTDDGVVARLSLDDSVAIPSDVDADVRSQTALGEQYVALSPRDDDSPPLRNGDVIPRDRTSVGPDTTLLLNSIASGLQAVPEDNLKTVIDESYTALGGLGPELSRIVKGSTQLALDARANLDPLIALIDQAGPVLDSQTDSADAIESWAANLSTITDQLRTHDESVTGFLQNGPPAAEELRTLIERVTPTLPVLLANLVSVGDVAVTYQPALEQILVLVPQGIAGIQAGNLANHDTKQAYRGTYLDFNLNLNLPAPCTTGFLPPQQIRPPTFEDSPERPEGDLYCRIPQDSDSNVRGARNYPCMTRPGKRAPTVKMCESDEQYVPLNEGTNWKGDPNATLSGQGIPQLPADPTPPPASPPPPLAVAPYDPVTGSYVGPDGRTYTQSNLAPPTENQTWQTMLLPPTGN
ncbi:MlaD family protein [Mycobacterium sp. 236(2023)]|uniref:MCE family protein n=1 Tax=Mycobacterium sp. 236(2023) TaxID=3038163 RepID=UPI002415054C|nr:MlaD family protein [Mycobacterium sp. 236(2023)]MDG4668061.1 MlaD family protein [Mycobacterium sp. 236(2023)]